MSLQGTILGYSADTGTGAITGTDGQRYRFVAAEWKGDGTPAPGDQVDFEATEGGHAEGIYPLRPAAAGPATPRREGAPDGRSMIAGALRRPALVIALIVLAVSGFVSVIEVTPPPNAADRRLPDAVTILQLPELMDAARQGYVAGVTSYSDEIELQGRILDQIREDEARDQQLINEQVNAYRRMRAAYGPYYGYERAPEAYGAELRAQSAESRQAERVEPARLQAMAQARLDRLKQEEVFINLGLILFLIPATAALVLLLELAGRPSRLAGLLLALVSLVGFGAVYFARSRLGALFGDLAGEPQLASSRGPMEAAGAQAASIAAAGFTPDARAAAAGEALLAPGLGAWLLLAAAAALIAAGFGLIRSKPAPVEVRA